MGDGFGSGRIDTIFLVPHQDDEVLAFGVGIVEATLLGQNVAVALLSDGSACPTRLTLANGGSCPDIGDRHCYTIDQPHYGRLRDREFADACVAMGVAPENVWFANPRQPDGGMTFEDTRAYIATLLERFPNAHFCTHAVIEPPADLALPPSATRNSVNELESLGGSDASGLTWHPQHKDHRTLASAALSLYQEGAIASLEAFVEFYHLAQFRHSYPDVDLVSHVVAQEEQRRIHDAIEAYAVWSPEQERYALGLHSARKQLRFQQRHPRGFSFVPVRGNSVEDAKEARRQTALVRKRVKDVLAQCARIEHAVADAIEGYEAELANSTTWKAGRAATVLPRTLKDSLRRSDADKSGQLEAAEGGKVEEAPAPAPSAAPYDEVVARPSTPRRFTAYAREGFDFLFSFVVPVYNTEDYLVQALESIVEQDIGFEEHIQLVLVNDGSTDGSAALCRSYQERFPDNVVFIDGQNAGASAARCSGLEAAVGKFVNFFDSDDYWSQDACSTVAAFFEDHEGISIASTQHKKFGGTGAGEAPLAFKYASEKVVDIFAEPAYIQTSVSNLFIERRLLSRELFDTRLKFAEDMLVANRLILKEGRYGVVPGPVYWYRKRDDESSIQDSAGRDLSWWVDTPRYCLEELFDLSRQLHGSVVPYIQRCVFSDIQWRLESKSIYPLDNDGFERYRDVIVGLLDEIDVDTILSFVGAPFKTVGMHYLLLALALKARLPFSELQRRLAATDEGMVVSLPELDCHSFVAPIDNPVVMSVQFLEAAQDCCVVEGTVHTLFPSDRVSLSCLSDSGAQVAACMGTNPCRALTSVFEKDFFAPVSFKVEQPYESFRFSVEIDGVKLPTLLRFEKFSTLKGLNEAYAQVGDHVLVVREPFDHIDVYPASPDQLAMREQAFQESVRSSYGQYQGWMDARKAHVQQRAAGAPRKRIWLISDKPHRAGDNGEALFAYLQQHPVAGVEPCFVLSESSADYARLSSMGTVVPFRSQEHFEKTLEADVVISSSGYDNAFLPFPAAFPAVADLASPPFVYLQSGVNAFDTSAWLNRYEKNIALFVTSSQAEADAIAAVPRYGYDGSTLCTVGMPRFDRLRQLAAETSVKKRLVFVPAFQPSLVGVPDAETGQRRPLARFLQSGAAQLFNRLINDPALIAAAQEAGCEMKLLLGPYYEQESGSFSSPYAQIATGFDYAKELAEASCLVTDYSSVAFDFALLGKPLVYAQFDRAEFFSRHYADEGFFDFDNDGFGPVCTSYEELRVAVEGCMKQDGMAKPYADRAERFFSLPQGSSCGLLVEAIEDMLSERRVWQH